ncbi:hypothetical protein ACJ73_06469 [Blastomyces percursus]|uniref:Glutamyl/glutaminyl-tRNA synthetase class Ib catalytic domain-containing protein n=1 Tax=Blastomyces percursus TaxID=1658174 RepID=A0A1J9Q0Y6_9EURO|nr:hypothetical protein ACJ73_06469 [Blastomyces percursus]
MVGIATCACFDDKNPKGEEERYIQSIKELARWLGFNPVCTPCSSDYFDRLYELAEALILKDKAYEAVLRMKPDLSSGNPQMWDIAAYRVVEDDEGDFCNHLRAGDKWKVYPTYDSTHCLYDSFEGVTHSLYTTEFELSRESYE